MGSAIGNVIHRALKREVLVCFVPIALIYLAQAAVFKTIQIRTIEGEFVLNAVLLGMALEVQFLLPLIFVGAVCYGLARGFLRGIVLTLYGLIMLFSLVASAFNHGYLISTGSKISFGTVQYWINNMAGANDVIASEASGWKVTLLLMQFVWLALAAILPRTRRIKKWIHTPPTKDARVAWFCAAFAAVFLGSFVVPNAKGRAAAASGSVPVNIVQGALSQLFMAGKKVRIADDERQGGALRFSTSPGAPRPNVVFIIFESLNFKSSDIHTPGLGTTPFLAELAKKSAVVKYPYTIIPHTSKAVVPLLCGIYPYFNQKTIENTPGILPKRCLAHILGEQGYRSAFFQPAYNFEKRDALVRNMGFDVYKGSRDYPRKGFESISYFGTEDKVMVVPSMKWVDSVRDKPFLLTYLTLATHHNYVTPQSYPYVDFGKEDKSHNDYLNAIRYVDDFIREVFEAFESRGLTKDTIFVIAGDHGEAFAEHGRRQHDLIMWEEGLRTTALVYAPGLVEGGQFIEGIRSNLDFVPTVASLLSLKLEAGRFVGQDLFGPVSEDRKLFHACWFNNECMAMRDGFIKTIFHYGSQEMEVYDTRSDPFDIKDLAGTSHYDETYLESKKEKMLRFKRVVNQQYRDWKANSVVGNVTTTRPQIERELDATVGEKIQILGVEAPKRAVAGQAIQLKLLFKSLMPALSSDGLFVHIMSGKRYLNADHVPLGGTYPLKMWRPGEYVLDEHSVHIPGTWPEGEMRIYVGVWNKRKKKRYRITRESAAGGPLQKLLVANISVEATRTYGGLTEEQTREKIGKWVGRDEPPFEKRFGVRFGDAVELVGVTLERVRVMQAGTAELTYVFKSLKKVNPKWRLLVSLVREDGTTIAANHVPIGGLYPLSNWNPGDYVVDKHRIHIDMYRSKVGTYGVWLGFMDGGKKVPVLSGEPTDPSGRVRIGEVVISKKDARQ